MMEIFNNRFSWKLLRAFCPPHLLEEIEGDLLEQFERDIRAFGEGKAKRRMVWNVVRFFRPGIVLRNKFSVETNQGYMLGNYLKVMKRHVMRRKFYSAINVLGLTVGITFALLLGMFILGELKVNANLKEVDRLYLLESHYKTTEEGPPFFVPLPAARQMVEQYPTLATDYYQFRDREIALSKGDKHLRVQAMIGDSTFFSMFGFPVMYGNSATAFLNPNAIVVTEKIARQYFNRADVVGETLTLATERNGPKEFLITAVMEDLQQKNSVSDFMNMNAQVFLSFKNADDFTLGYRDDWTTDIITYIKLAPHATVSEATMAMDRIIKKDAPSNISEKRNIAFSPLQDYYLVTNHGAVKKLLVSLGTVVLFILLLAIVNFINITIATSFSRLKEVGVRKVMGGVRKGIILQFLTESILLTLFAGILSLFLYHAMRNYFGDMLGTPLPSFMEFDLSVWAWMTGAILLIGILAGSYPSMYLSATESIESMKGKFKSVKGTIQVSRGLIGIQFLIALFVFVTSLVMSRQVSYFFEKDMGYDQSFVLTVTSVPRLWNEEGFVAMETAKQQFLSSPHIHSVSLSWGTPMYNFSPVEANIRLKGQSQEKGVQVSMGSVDEDYAKVYQLKIREGKFFFDEGETRKGNGVVINESAQKALGVTLGDEVEFFNGTFTVVGIVGNFHFESLQEKIKPMVMMHNRDFQAFRHFSFKLGAGDLMQSVHEVEKMWKQVFPHDAFVYTFSDERLKLIYKTELQLKKASRIATGLILFIVLTGVLGLTSLNISKRNKEIGIRKVLGATSSNILVLVSKEYALLIALSFVISVPLSYLFIDQWLKGFAYHIEVQGWMFIAPMLVLFAFTLLLVAGQSLRTALANPVKSLKYE